MRSFFLLTAFLLIASCGCTQELQQKISGQILDNYRSPLSGATIILFNDQSKQVTSSSEDGRFAFEKVRPDRYQLRVMFVGYAAYEEELLVISARDIQLSIVLTESAATLKDVIVTPDSTAQPEIGVRSVSIEKTMRMAANFFDPVRMITSYPGVVASNDQNNSIIVKGYSPNALLWRLQGLDIVNPNHLANAGTLSDKPVSNGGGVNVLSAQVLDKTDFYSGALPVQYGNALSGALNMSLREGSKTETHYTAQASLIGMDVSAETPVVKGKSSVLANYRYSTVGLLSSLGVNFGDEKINFQDLSFHYHHNQKNNSTLSVFGFAGLSLNEFDGKPQSEWKEEKDRYKIDFDGKVFGMGFTENIPLTPKSYVKIGSALSGQFQNRNAQSVFVPFPHLSSDSYESNKLLISNFINWNYRATRNVAVEGGIYANHIDHRLGIGSRYFTMANVYFGSYSDVHVDGWLLQPYVSSTITLSRNLQAHAGVRYVQFTYNNTDSWEPRLDVVYHGKLGSLQLNYSRTSQYQPIQVYLANNPANVDLTLSDQWNLNYQKTFVKQWQVKSSVYFHQQSHVPSNAAIGYSALNSIEEFELTSMQSVGRGRNYGWDIFLEKKFDHQLYLMGGGSLYRAEFATNEASSFEDTRFSGRFTFNALGGKEWNRKKNTLGIHLRLLYLGGMKERAIQTTLSQLSGSTQYDLSQGYIVQLPDYFRTDARIAWRKNKPRYTRTISIDIQNLTGQQNVGYHYYDTYLQSVKTKYQLSLIPILVYRVDL